MTGLVAALATSALLLTGTPATVADVRLTLPDPTGRHRIGTVSLHLTDRSRPDPWVPAEPARELMVQIWYPARSVHGHPRAGWVSPGVAARINPPGSGLRLPVTHGHIGAPAAPGRRPVVLYSPGFGLERTSSTALVEDLASHGYVVVTVDHTYDAQLVEFPDGRIAARAVPPDTDIARALAVRVADSRFVLDRLTRTVLPHGITVDPARIGMLGHSLGGAAAADTMRADRRVRAGINMDGTFAGPVLGTGLDRPFLMLGAEPDPAEPDESWNRMWAGLRGPRHWLELRGARHLSFTDFQVLWPQAGVPAADSARAIGTIDGGRSVAVQRVYVRAFLDRYLRHRDGRLLAGPSPRHPEMLFRP